MRKIKLDLQYFAEAEGQPATGTAEPTQAPEATGAGEGDQVAPEGPTFDELIESNPEYKKALGARIHEGIEKRFKNQKDLQKRIDSITPALEALARQHGIKADDKGELDFSVLCEAILNDNALYEQDAFDHGMTVEDMKHLRQIEAENERLKRANDAASREAESKAAYEAFLADVEEAKQTYPNLDIEAEMQDPQFGRLIASGVPVKTAYQVTHNDEILAGAIKIGVDKATTKVANSVKANGMRPAENGLSSQSAANTGKFDPSQLKLADFQKIKERVMAGEQIVF